MSNYFNKRDSWMVVAGANPREKGICDTTFGHYGVTFATISFEREYSHMPEYGAKMAAEYASVVAAAPDLYMCLSDLVEGLEDMVLPGSLPARLAKAKVALEKATQGLTV